MECAIGLVPMSGYVGKFLKRSMKGGWHTKTPPTPKELIKLWNIKEKFLGILIELVTLFDLIINKLGLTSALILKN